jgi:hypothetical protein
MDRPRKHMCRVDSQLHSHPNIPQNRQLSSADKHTGADTD